MKKKKSFSAARLGSLSLGATQDLKEQAVKGGYAGSASKLLGADGEQEKSYRRLADCGPQNAPCDAIKAKSGGIKRRKPG